MSIYSPEKGGFAHEPHPTVGPGAGPRGLWRAPSPSVSAWPNGPAPAWTPGEDGQGDVPSGSVAEGELWTSPPSKGLIKVCF